MKKFFLRPFILSSLFTIIFFLISCDKQDSQSGNYILSKIPADVTAVLQIDLPTLRKKGDLENIKEMPFFKEMLTETDFQDPGIDMTKAGYFYFFLNPKDIEEGFFGMVFHLTNPDQLATLMQQNGETIKEDGPISYVQRGAENAIGWDKNGICLVGFSDSGLDPAAEVKRFFAGTLENSISNHSDLKKCLSNKHDISLWMNLDAVAKNEQARLALSLGSFKADVLEENYFHGFLDFEKGSIDANLEWFLQKGLTKDLDKLFKDGATEDLSAFIPDENPVFYLAHSLDLRGWNEIISARPQFKSLLSYALREYGLSVEDFVYTFGGDMTLSFFNTEQTEGLSGLFVTNIEKREMLDKFLEVAVKMNELEKIEENLYFIPSINGNFAVSFTQTQNKSLLLVHDNKIFISGNQQLLQDIQEGQQSKHKKLSQLAKDNLFALMLHPSTTAEIAEDLFPVTYGFPEAAVTINRKGAYATIKIENKEVNSLKYLLEKAATNNQ